MAAQVSMKSSHFFSFGKGISMQVYFSESIRYYLFKVTELQTNSSLHQLLVTKVSYLSNSFTNVPPEVWGISFYAQGLAKEQQTGSSLEEKNSLRNFMFYSNN